MVCCYSRRNFSTSKFFELNFLSPFDILTLIQPGLLILVATSFP